MESSSKVLVVLVALLALIPGGGWAQGYQPKETEELYGIWTSETADPQEGVLTPGRFEEYSNFADRLPTWSGTERIDDRWTDAEGNVWYKTFRTLAAGSSEGTLRQTLRKISNAGANHEVVFTEVQAFDPSRYPSGIDPKDQTYLSYIRAGSYVAREDELLYGTWTNGGMPRQKIVASPGWAMLYTRISDTSPFEEARELIAEKWTDSEGSAWYRTFSIRTSGPLKGMKSMSLLKISKSGTVREVFWRVVGFFSLKLSLPRVDPNDRDHYAIWYRAKD